MAFIGASPRDLVRLVKRPLRLDKVGLDRKERVFDDAPGGCLVTASIDHALAQLS